MAPTIITTGSIRSNNRLWAIAAVAVWLIAAALVGFYLLDGRGQAKAGLAADTTSLNSATSEHSGTPTPVTTNQQPVATVAPTSTTEQPTTTTTTGPPALVVAASGDVLGDRGVGLYIDKHGPDGLFAGVKPLLAGAQLAFVNLECPLSSVGTEATWKEYTFRGRPALAEALVDAGIDVVSLANNHSMDWGSKALLDTLARLDRAGVKYAGAGADAAKASAPALLITPAGMVAVLAFTDIIPGGFAAGSKSPGVNVTTPDAKGILAAVKKAAEKADFVIVSFHWGEEYEPHANQAQQKLAHQVIEAGADLVLGHHPHVLQGLELYQGGIIAYSLGDFVWDHYSQVTGETVVLRVTIPPNGAPSLEAVPVYLDEVTGAPVPVAGDHAVSILGRLASLSAELGLQLTISEDRAFYPAAAGGP